jgi:hypothetical protein
VLAGQATLPVVSFPPFGAFVMAEVVVGVGIIIVVLIVLKKFPGQQ